MNKRLSLLKKYIDENNLSCVIITDRKNMMYLCSYTGEGYLIITKDKDYLVTDFRYTEQASLQAEGFEVCDIADIDIKEKFSKYEKAGFEDLNISYSSYRKFLGVFPELVPVGDILLDMRSVKDSEEIEAIRKAQEIGDKTFTHILDYIKPDVSERDIALEIEYHMRSLGADGLSFDSVVATGAHGAMPHAEPDGRKIKNGDMVVLDFGCVYKGYCGDMTRTVCVGRAEPQMKKIYDTVLRAQLSCLDMVKAGETGANIHNNALAIIEKEFPKTFGHGLGHGVGLNVHESPNLSPRNIKPLIKGSVVTVEPGIYIPGYCGVRIEDLVVVEDGGYTNLTFSPKNLIEL